MVECYLPKVKVTSSTLVSRSEVFFECISSDLFKNPIFAQFYVYF